MQDGDRSGELEEARRFMLELIDNLNVKTMADGEGGSDGSRFFPHGINDISVKISVGPVTVDVNVSSGSAPTHQGIMGEPPDDGPLPDRLVRPMYLVLPQKIKKETIKSATVKIDGFYTNDNAFHVGPIRLATGVTELDLNDQPGAPQS